MARTLRVANGAAEGAGRAAGAAGRQGFAGAVMRRSVAGRLRDDSGFTLIELVTAFFIIAITLVPLMALFYESMSISSQNAVRAEAISAASREIETLTAIPFGALGYYIDEFTNSSMCPAGAPELLEYKKLFITDQTQICPQSSWTTAPFQLPNSSQTAFAGACSPPPPGYSGTYPTLPSCTGSDPTADLVKPFQLVPSFGATYAVYTVVSWQYTETPTTSECAYKEATVYVWWKNGSGSYASTTASSEIYPGGLGANGNADGHTACSNGVVTNSFAPNAPYGATLTPDPTRDAITVGWNENSSSNPVGYFVIGWSADPGFYSKITSSPWDQPSDVRTSPIEAPSSSDVNQSATGPPYTYSYNILGLSPNTTYYVVIWAYSQDGSNFYNGSFTPPFSIANAGSTTTVPSTNPVPPCEVDSTYISAMPPNGTMQSGQEPYLTGKVYLGSSNLAVEDLYLGAGTAYGCVPGALTMTMGTGIPGTDWVATGNVYTLNSDWSSGSGDVQYYVVTATNLAYLTPGFWAGQVTVGTTVLYSPLLVCPYTAPNERSASTSKC